MIWDVLPAADEITQPLGCVPNISEWPAPWCATRRFHSGVDLGSTRGGWAIFKAPIYATRAATVVRVGYPNGLGDQAVFLELDASGWLIYGHLEQALCRVGDRLTSGQKFGLLGTRGNSTAPHLHLEYRTDGPLQNVDRNAAGVGNPVPFLYAAGMADGFADSDRTTLNGIYNLLSGAHLNGPSLDEMVSTVLLKVSQTPPGSVDLTPVLTAVADLRAILVKIEGALKSA